MMNTAQINYQVAFLMAAWLKSELAVLRSKILELTAICQKTNALLQSEARIVHPNVIIGIDKVYTERMLLEQEYMVVATTIANIHTLIH